jgi:HrpA-like RNA helicase
VAETSQCVWVWLRAIDKEDLEDYLCHYGEQDRGREEGVQQCPGSWKGSLYLPRKWTRVGKAPFILCVLLGWDEIKLTMNILQEIDQELLPKLNLIVSYLTIPKEDQHRIFDPAEEDTMKIIIAESSVTINDALAFIDAGLVRAMNWNAESEMSTIPTMPKSKASATQRLSRAGRVAPGRCYWLYSRGFLHSMTERPSPEIQRAGLENTCLQACGTTTDGVQLLSPDRWYRVQLFLSRAMDPLTSD